MTFLRFFNPVAAIRDLRIFLSGRQRHELIFGFLALATTIVVVTAFFYDTDDLKRPWKRDIVYVQSWPLDRSLAEIRAQQKIDEPKKKAEQEKLEALQKQRQAQFKKVDDALNRWGL